MLTPRTKKKSIVIVATSFSCLIERRIPGRRGVTLIPPAVMNPNWDITQGRTPDLFSHYGSSTVASPRKEWKRQPEKYSTSGWEKKIQLLFVLRQCKSLSQHFFATCCHLSPLSLLPQLPLLLLRALDILSQRLSPRAFYCYCLPHKMQTATLALKTRGCVASALFKILLLSLFP